MTIDTVKDRYLRDPLFHTLVEILLAQLNECSFTPTELREAAMLAASIHDVRHVQPLVGYDVHGDIQP